MRSHEKAVLAEAPLPSLERLARYLGLDVPEAGEEQRERLVEAVVRHLDTSDKPTPIPSWTVRDLRAR